MLSPTGLRQSPAGGADNFAPVKIPVKNVTASAFVQYGLYALDLTQSDGDVTSIDLALSSLIPVATANMATGMLCVVQSAIAAGDTGFAVIQGRTKMVTNGSAILKGSPLKGVNASYKVAIATIATDRHHAIALEVNGSVDATTIQALLICPYGTF